MTTPDTDLPSPPVNPIAGLLDSLKVVLEAAGSSLSEEQIAAVEQFLVPPEPTAPAEPEGDRIQFPTNVLPIGAMAEPYTTQVQRVDWHQRLKSAIKIFMRRYQDLHDLGDSELKEYYDIDNDQRETAVKQLVTDMASVMQSLSTSHPGATDDIDARYQGMEAPYLYLAAKQDGSDGDEPSEVNHILIDFSAAATHGNRQQLSGVLFQVDQPSEAIPAVGPGMPLYIPRNVALSCLGKVAGLPIVSSENLSSHDNEKPYGTILKAELKGNDFVVFGHLWDEACPDWVSKIAANADKDQLGMSMNASAFGHAVDVGGQQVFWIDSLDIKGGNILFADKATYQNTSARLLAASKLDPSQDICQTVPIAAATTTPVQLDDDDTTMDTQQINQQLTDIQATLQGLPELINTVNGINQRLAATEATVSEISAERTAQQQQVAAEANRIQREAETTALIEGVAAAVMERINPTGVPARRGVSLMAGGSNTTTAESGTNSKQLMEYRIELAQIEERLSHPSLVTAADCQRKSKLEFLIQQLGSSEAALV